MIGESDNFISGTDTFFLPTGLDSFIGGSAGTDSLTLIGGAQTGDEVNLGDGVDSLVLANVTNSIGIENVENVTPGTAPDNITVHGGTSLSGVLNSLTGSDTVVIDGTVTVQGETVSTGVGSFTTNMGSELRIGGSSGASDFTFNTFTTNAGLVSLDGPASSILTVSTGVLNNNSVIRSEDTGAATPPAHRLDADVTLNSGAFINVQYDLDVINNSVINLNNGNLYVKDGEVFRLDNSTLQVQKFSNIFSDTNQGGSIVFDNNSTLAIDPVNGSFGIGNFMAKFDFQGTTTIGSTGGAVTLDIFQDTELKLTGDTVTADVTLNNTGGTLKIENGNTSLLGTYNSNADSDLMIISSTANGAGQLTAADSVTNNGVLEFDTTDAATSTVSSLVVNGSGNVTNTTSGEIISKNTGGSLAASHTVDGHLKNSGLVKIESDLTFNQASGAHQNNTSGVIALNNASLTITSGSSFNNTGFIAGNGTISTDVTLFSNGVITPGFSPPASTISVNGDVTLGATSTIVIDLFDTTVSGHDTFAVSGNLAAAGGVKLNFASDSGFDGGETITDVITTGNVAGSFMPATHNLAAGYDVTLSPNGNNFDVVVADGF